MATEKLDIFSFTRREEAAYHTLPIAVVENYEWNMYKHVMTTVLYKNSQYITGKNDDKPFKNITRPILNLQYRAEGFDLKDIDLYVDDAEQYFKSFLIAKYHEKWARENNIDTFIDSLVESYVDFGGVLTKKANQSRPEVVPLQSLAFCDQTDLLSGPLGIKHEFSPDQLLDMASAHWGDEAYGATATLEEVVTLAQNHKTVNEPGAKQVKTPGKYIPVYEIHGMFPKSWLTGNDADENTYTRQLHIITFLQKQDGKEYGITLFHGPEKQSIFKSLLRDPIYGRALGLGGAEELFEAQVWTNKDVQRMEGLKDAAAKILYQTDDAAFATRNKTDDLENGEILVVEKGSEVTQINTVPINLQVFEKSVAEWESHAQQMGAANDAIMGDAPTSGTPFKLQELVTQEAHSLHEYRKGKIAIFLDEIYRDWIIPYIAKEITKGTEFLASLDLDELQAVADNVAIRQTNAFIKEKILNGEAINDADVAQFQAKARDQFMNGGSKRFIKILADELKDAPISVQVNIAGKEKDLSGYTDKLVNIFRQIMANPGILDDPRMAKLFNQILEASGLSPIDFAQKPQQPPPSNQPGPKVAESINFKDLPPEGKAQMAAQAGIRIGQQTQPTNQ